MLKHSFRRYVILGLCLAGIQGCGYQLYSTGKPRHIGISSLAIPLMPTTSTWIGAEAEFTRIIRQEFMRHSQVPLVSRDKASTVLIGKVYDIRTEPYSYTVIKKKVQGQEGTYELTSTRWLKVRLHAKLIERTSGKVIWEDKDMEERATYAIVNQPQPDPIRTQYNRSMALEAIAQRLAERMYLRTMERF
jgi:hypothetical protein